FSLEARSYTLLALLTLLAMQLCMNGINEKQVRLYFLAIISALLIYTHYLSIWVLIAVAITLLADKTPLKYPGKSLAALIIFLILISPLVLPALQRIGHMKETGTWVQAPVITQLYGHINLMWNGALMTVAAGLTGLTALYINRKNISALIIKREIGIPFLWFVVIYFGLYIQSLIFQPVFIPRYLFFASVPLFIFLAMLADESTKLIRKGWVLPLLILICLLPGLDFSPGRNRDMRTLVNRTLQLSEGTPLLVCPSHANLGYLCNAFPDLFFNGMEEAEINKQQHIFPINSFAEIPDSILNTNALVYLDVDAAFTLPQNGIEEGLQHYFEEIEIVRIPEIYEVSRWEKPAPGK
ncbi:MAG: hypothetical protein KDC13_10320, partial [Bacteroidetes bacterium]|nr:hypothetical protein [Bacteroidota bacterium]